jgi:hypothetical protein
MFVDQAEPLVQKCLRWTVLQSLGGMFLPAASPAPPIGRERLQRTSYFQSGTFYPEAPYRDADGRRGSD